MHSLPTTDARLAVAFSAVALASLTIAAGTIDFAADPDPRELLRAAPPPEIQPAAQFVEPAHGELIDEPLAAPYAAAAPIGEPAPTRSALAEPEIQVVAIGRNARSSCDADLIAAYRSTLRDMQCRTVACTDRETVDLMMLARADFGLIGGKLSRREVQAGLRQTQIGVELFALSVAPDSDVRSLTPQQVRQIFTGAATEWSQLGFEGGEITAVVPSDGALAERAERVLIPGDRFASRCVAVQSERHAVDQLLQHPDAIAIVRITAEPREPGQQLVQIGWTPPTPAAFGYGTYPFGIPLQLVTSGQPDQQALDFLAFAESDEGRRLLGRTLTFVPR